MRVRKQLCAPEPASARGGLPPVTLSRQVSASVLVELGRQQQFALLDDPAGNTWLEISVIVEQAGR